MRAFLSTSPSQISSYDECPRLWWFTTIFGLQKPQKASAELGSATHTVLETFMEEGTPPDLKTQVGQIAAPVIDILTNELGLEPGDAWLETKMHDPESVFPLVVIADIPVHGYIDLLVTETHGKRELPLFRDYKTTSAEKWIKTVDDLRGDPQMLLYGEFFFGMLEHLGIETTTVSAGHITTLTTGHPRAKHIPFELSREDIAAGKPRLVEIVEGMKRDAKALTPDKVRGEPSACTNYGGCYFRPHCRALGLLEAETPVPAFLQRALASSTRPVTTPVTPSTESLMSTEVLTPMQLLRKAKAERLAAAGTTGAGGDSASGTPSGGPPTPGTPPGASQSPSASTLDAEDAAAARRKTMEKYNITPSTPPGPSVNTQSVTPPDAPPRVAPTFLTNSPTPPAADGAAAPQKKPPGYMTKLPALGWTPAQIEKMTSATMRHIIAEKLNGAGYSVMNDGSLQVPGKGTVDTSAPETPAAPPARAAGEAVEWYFHAESDSFTSMTRAQFEFSVSQGSDLVHVGDDSAKEAFVAALDLDEAGSADPDLAENTGAVDEDDEVAAMEKKLAEAKAAKIAKAEAAKKAEADRLAAEAAKKAEADRLAAEAAKKAEAEAALTKSVEATPKTPKVVVAPKQVDTGLRLYIDCQPTKGEDVENVQYLEDILAPVLPKALVAHNAGAKDAEKVDYFGIIPFGRGPGFVAAALMKEPPTGVVVCWTRLPATNACLEILIPLATDVIRGR